MEAKPMNAERVKFEVTAISGLQIVTGGASGRTVTMTAEVPEAEAEEIRVGQSYYVESAVALEPTNIEPDVEKEPVIA